jgi:hypothetical protein
MNPIDRVIAISQIFMLAAWEALGIIAFSWDPLVIAGCWFVGLWTFNILTATAVRTYGKLMTPRVEDNPPFDITEEDIGA